MSKVLITIIATLALVPAAVSAASDWAGQIGRVVPDNITVSAIEEADGSIEILGSAATNKDISVLMRAIDGADLGSPHLQYIKRKNGRSAFSLRVKRKR